MGLANMTKFLGGNHDAAGNSIAVTNDGGSIIAGKLDNDILLLKLDVDGNEVWSKTFGGAQGEHGYSVKQTTDGGYAVYGLTQSLASGRYDNYFIKTDASGNKQWEYLSKASDWSVGYSFVESRDGGYVLLGNSTKQDPWLDFEMIKIDATGQQQWVKYFANDLDDTGQMIKATSDGGYILLGYTGMWGSNQQGYVIKTDASGNAQWKTAWGGSGKEWFRDVVQSSDGSYLVAGITNSYGAGSNDALLLKLNSTGQVQWYKTYGGSGHDYATALALSGSGNYLLAGGGVSVGKTDIDAVVWEIDGSGNLVSTQTYGGAKDDGVESIVTWADGYRLVGGATSTVPEENDILFVQKGTAATDTLAPTITSFSPADEATGVVAGSKIVITFSEAIQFGTGQILLKHESGTTYQTFQAGGSGLSINGSTLTISPFGGMIAAGTLLRLELPAGAIKDLAGNNFAGSTSYNFTTASATQPPTQPATASKDDQFIILQPGSPNVVGAGTGNDTYLISGSMLPAGKSLTISDAIGNNSIQLAPGLSIASSQVAASALKLNLSNGASITVLGADKFSYDVGGNTSAGRNNTDVSYQSLVTGTLGTTLPSAGVSTGSSRIIDSMNAATLLASTSTGDDFVALQYASPNVVGAGVGNDTYLITNDLLPAGTNLTISDAQGSNSIQLASGLKITSSQVASSALKLTLDSGATITILGANNFTYDVGGNTSAGIDNVDVSYATLVQNTLGATLPTTGVVTGGAVTVGTATEIPTQPPSSTEPSILIQPSGIMEISGAGYAGTIDVNLALGTYQVGANSPQQIAALENFNTFKNDVNAWQMPSTASITMTGSSGGNDGQFFSGGRGNDVIVAAGSHWNWLNGGPGGDDQITGNSGNDSFVTSLMLNGESGDTFRAFDPQRDSLILEAHLHLQQTADLDLSGLSATITTDGSGVWTENGFKVTFTGLPNTAIPNFRTGIWGDNRDNRLTGHDGDTALERSDLLIGGEGNDTLIGLGGRDALYGNAGADTLTGGAGSDRFVFEYKNASTLTAMDVITDFSTNPNDHDWLHFGNNWWESGESIKGYNYKTAAHYTFATNIATTVSAILADASVANTIVTFHDGASTYLYVNGAGSAAMDYDGTLVKLENGNFKLGDILQGLTPTLDNVDPTLQSSTPADNALSVAVNANISLIFSEAMKAASGNLIIKKTADDSTVATIATTDATQVSISGGTVTINPTNDLTAGTGYYVQLASGALSDLAGNAYAGISDKTTLNFTTGSSIPANVLFPVTSTQGTANGLTFGFLDVNGNGTVDTAYGGSGSTTDDLVTWTEFDTLDQAATAWRMATKQELLDLYNDPNITNPPAGWSTSNYYWSSDAAGAGSHWFVYLFHGGTYNYYDSYEKYAAVVLVG
jgi:Ca2+-binding RTX toxin-like protein/methionine-rich copper-binding protein CopC